MCPHARARLFISCYTSTMLVACVRSFFPLVHAVMCMRERGCGHAGWLAGWPVMRYCVLEERAEMWTNLIRWAAGAGCCWPLTIPTIPRVVSTSNHNHFTCTIHNPSLNSRLISSSLPLKGSRGRLSLTHTHACYRHPGVRTRQPVARTGLCG